MPGILKSAQSFTISSVTGDRFTVSSTANLRKGMVGWLVGSGGSPAGHRIRVTEIVSTTVVRLSFNPNINDPNFAKGTDYGYPSYDTNGDLSAYNGGTISFESQVVSTAFDADVSSAGSDYLALSGVAGGQTAYGGTGASERLILRSSSNATPGSIDIGIISSNAVLRVSEVSPGMVTNTSGTTSANPSTPQISLRAPDVTNVVHTTGYVNSAGTMLAYTRFTGSMVKHIITGTGTSTTNSFEWRGNATIGTNEGTRLFQMTIDSSGYPTGGLGGLPGPGGNWSVATSKVGGTVDSTVTNNDNTNAASHSSSGASVAGSSSGDPFFRMTVSGANSFYVGIDNDDSDALKIGPASSINTSNSAFCIDVNKNVYLGTPGAIAASATTGFVCIPGTTNTPGTPSLLASQTGKYPIYINTSTNTLYVWNGSAWKGIALL